MRECRSCRRSGAGSAAASVGESQLVRARHQHNLFRSEYRKRRREVEDVDGSYAEQLTFSPEQSTRLEINEFREALKLLPPEQREALILVGASGFSYEEAARICGCAVGTIKSRVNRARGRLAEILSIEDTSDFGPDRETRAVVNSDLLTRRS